MEDVLKRLGGVESAVAEVRSQVSGLATQVNGLATQLGGVAAQVTVLTADVSSLKASFPHLATKADIVHVENSVLRWLVATVIAALGLIFVIAKYTA